LLVKNGMRLTLIMIQTQIWMSQQTLKIVQREISSPIGREHHSRGEPLLLFLLFGKLKLALDLFAFIIFIVILIG
jgi:hypothetical protein